MDIIEFTCFNDYETWHKRNTPTFIKVSGRYETEFGSQEYFRCNNRKLMLNPFAKRSLSHVQLLKTQIESCKGRYTLNFDKVTKQYKVKLQKCSNYRHYQKAVLDTRIHKLISMRIKQGFSSQHLRKLLAEQENLSLEKHQVSNIKFREKIGLV